MADDFFGEEPSKDEQKKVINAINIEDLENVVRAKISEKKQDDKKSYILKEDVGTDKIVITAFGDKGGAKTTTVFGLPGTIACFCFDKKSGMIKKYMYNDDSRIKVYDVVADYDKSPKNFIPSSGLVMRQLCETLDMLRESPNKPDWVFIDGHDVLITIAEMVMRGNNGLSPFQGIANRGVWKERKSLLASIHNKAMNASKKGVIYSTYTKNDEIIEEGTVITKEKVPNWFDIAMQETDVLIYCEGRYDRNEKKKRFFIRIDNSKVPAFQTGVEIEITDKKLSDLVKL